MPGLGNYDNLSIMAYESPCISSDSKRVGCGGGQLSSAFAIKAGGHITVKVICSDGDCDDISNASWHRDSGKVTCWRTGNNSKSVSYRRQNWNTKGDDVHYAWFWAACGTDGDKPSKLGASPDRGGFGLSNYDFVGTFNQNVSSPLYNIPHDGAITVDISCPTSGVNKVDYRCQNWNTEFGKSHNVQFDTNCAACIPTP